MEYGAINFELKQLRSYLAVLEEKSFTMASRRLRLGQATISTHISQLESALGTVLIERSSKGFSVTPQGELFREYCESLFAGLERLGREMQAEGGPSTLSIAASTVPSQYIIPGILPTIFGMFPGVKLHVEVADSREVVEMVKAGGADMGISGRRVMHASLVYHRICGDSIVLISSGKGPAALVPSEIPGLPLVGRERGSGTRGSCERALMSKRVRPSDLRYVMECTTTECVKQAVMAGVGAAFVSSLSVRDELARGLLRIVPVKGLSIQRDFFALWMKSHRRRDAVRRLASALTALLAGK
ncbi:MAG: LysR family transcriptional regulator [Spirochaetes bacterium]|nr:LysR family transcriptional regulator [Spirochaetota bacterium]